ncbi:MAG: SAM-dependent chlorinase/fluorinase, partial [Magnetococcales bacterium]|nr:SAM-dependent chlorinase/fluorinase [Magnetococcales bacterium]
LFAPVAARLHRGEPLANLGNFIDDPIQLDNPGWSSLSGNAWNATIMLVDRYGNLITALPGSEVDAKRIHGTLHGQPCGSLVTTFSSLPPGQPGLVVGGFGTVEVIVNQESAERRFHAQPGDRVLFSEGGWWGET